MGHRYGALVGKHPWSLVFAAEHGSLLVDNSNNSLERRAWLGA